MSAMYVELDAKSRKLSRVAVVADVIFAVLLGLFTVMQAYPLIRYSTLEGTGDPRWLSSETLFHSGYELVYTPPGGESGMCAPGPCWWLGQFVPHGEIMVDSGATWASLMDGRYKITPDQTWFLGRVAAQYPWVTEW